MAAQWGTESPGHAGVLTSTSLWVFQPRPDTHMIFIDPLGLAGAPGRQLEEEASIWKRGSPPL